MIQTILKMLGGQLLQRAVARGGLQKVFDWRLGLQLMRNGRVPVGCKVQAGVLGLLALVALEVLELPIQAAMWAFLPLIGFAADAAIDGVELLAIPFLVATIALPFLAPRDIVDGIRRGRSGNYPNTDEQGRVYDAASSKVR